MTTKIYPMVQTVSISATAAVLEVMAEFVNYGTAPVSGTITVQIGQVAGLTRNKIFGSYYLGVFIAGQCGLQQVINPGVQQIFINSSKCAILNVQNPLLWWPVQMGTPNIC
jgi:hypothetical protein